MAAPHPASAAGPAPRTAGAITFDRHKYGAELLVDVGRPERMRGYILDDAPHWLDFHEIAFVTRGAGTLHLDWQPLPVAPGHVLFTSPGQVRSWRLSEPLAGHSLFFAPEFLSAFFTDPLFLHTLGYFHAPQPRALVLPPAEWPAVERILLEAEEEVQARRPDAAHMLRALTYRLLVALKRAWGTADEAPASPAAVRVRRFQLLVEEHFRTLHRVADYAGLLAVTPGHLNAITRACTGRTASALIHARLLTEARRLLLYSDRSAAQIAADLGFEDASYFGRFFRRATGRSPNAFRHGPPAP